MVWGPAGVLKDRNARIYLAGVLVSGFGSRWSWPGACWSVWGCPGLSSAP